MSFIWPWALLSLLLLLPSVLLYVRMQRKRVLSAANLGTLGAVNGVLPSRAIKRRHIPAAILLVGLAVLAIATARPQVTLPLPRLEGTLVLAFDVSASMAATDADPTRMEAAQLVANTFVERRPSNAKIGIVAFGESGLIVQPPTDDVEALRATIDRMTPQSGTSLGRGILTALQMVSEAPLPTQQIEGRPTASSSATPQLRGAFAPAVIVVLTDGENTDPPDPLEVAQTAIQNGVRVYTVGIGTTEGATLEIEGFNVFTQLNQPMLQEIAMLTEGAYFNVDSSDDVTAIYEELEDEFVVEPTEVEITNALGGISALLFLLGGALSLIWFGRVP